MRESQKKTKIGHLVLSLRAGGLEMLVANLIRRREMADIEFIVFCLDETGELAGIIENAGAKVILVKRRPGFDPRIILQLRKQFLREGLAVLHTHSFDPMFYGGIAGFLARIPIRLHTQHNAFLFKYGLKDKLKYWLASLFFHKLVAVSDQVKLGVRALGVPSRKCLTILNGVDERQFVSNAPNSSNPSSGANQKSGLWSLGTVARLAPEKDIGTMLDAFAEVAKLHSNSRLLIVGEGPSRKSLELHAEALGIETKVQFVGYKENTADYLRQMDLFVMSSVSEGIPLALLEAMSSRLPVVATAVGGIPEVVETGSSGLLVPPSNARALADALLEIMGSSDLREKLAKNAETRIHNHFSLSATARFYHDLYVNDGESSWSRFIKKHVLGSLPRRWMIWRGSRNSQSVALTFDDGPDPDFTPQILEFLRNRGVRSTFFLIGQRVEEQKDLVKQIASEGHEIANHSHSHPHFELLSIAAANAELKQAEATLRSIGVTSSGLFRPPRGKLCVSSIISAWLRQMTITMWSIDLKDFEAQTKEEIQQKLLTVSIAGGDIVLYHGNNRAALAALPAVIDAIVQNGRKCVPVSALIGRHL